MRRFGLVGKSLKHSFSKQYFDTKFRKEGIEASYENFEIESIDLIHSVFETPDLHGLNVTIPYKEKIIPYLDDLDDVAKEIKAVNTIVLSNNRKIGYNTDVFGFQLAIKPFLRNVHERALILGTGGASKAVHHVLKNLGINVCYLSRNPVLGNQFDYSQVNLSMIQAFKLIINTTPLGTFPRVDEHPPIPLDLFTQDHLVIDLIYNPEKSKLLIEAEKSGASILNGLSMLKHQANKSWEIFNL